VSETKRQKRLGRHLATLIVAGVLAVSFPHAGPAAAQQSGDADVMLQSAIQKELVEGDLEGAIEVYGRILEEFPDNRVVSAKAQLHIGLCYEKLGLTEAQRAYQRVIDGYPERQDEVAVARERLAQLTQTLAELNSTPSFRKIQIASNPQNGVLSSDGTQLAFTSQGSLWLLPLEGQVAPDIAGEPIRLTEPMGAWNWFHHLAWSGDGEWIAFRAKAEGAEQIHAISPATGEMREIAATRPSRKPNTHDYRLSLSPDGGTLAFVHKEREGATPDCLAGDLFVHTRPVGGGASSRLTPVVCTVEPTFSPDGEHIAYIRDLSYVVPGEPAIRKHRQLWVMTAAGGTPVLLFDSAAIRSPVWSPGGTMIAVLSAPDSGPSREVVIIPFTPGTGLREPIARVDLPRRTNGVLAGWTPDGELGVHLESEEHHAVYTAPVDGGKAVQVTPDLSNAFFPRWSPDGERIILIAQLFYDGSSWTPLWPNTLSRQDLEGEDDFFGLVSIPAEGGPTTPIRITGDAGVTPGVPPGGGVHVSPDGKTVLFAGIRYPDPDPPEVDIWTVPREGGEPTRLARSTRQDRFPCWSPDGERVAFLRTEYKGNGSYTFNIHVIPAEGGEPARLTSDADSVDQATIAYSPDGERIAFFSNGAIKTIPADGGNPEVLIAGVPSEGRHRLAWSPDGRKIAYTAANKIWMASVEGGEPVELRTGLPEDMRYGDFGWSPDGGKLTFLATIGGERELWLISDFLPRER